MTAAYDAYTPDGGRHRHVESMQNRLLEIRAQPDGTVEVVGVHETKEVRGWGGEIARPSFAARGCAHAIPGR